MSPTRSSIQHTAERTVVASDAVGHDTVGHSGAAEVAEQIRRMLANPRRTRR